MEELPTEVEWFTSADVALLANLAGVPIDSERKSAMLEHLNGCTHQFLVIAWPLQQRHSNTAIKKKLTSVESAARKLHELLDGDVLGLISTGAGIKIDEESGLKPIGANEEKRRVPFPLVGESPEEKKYMAFRLIAEMPEAIQALRDGIGGAQQIIERRVARTEKKNSQNKGDEALDELLWNLLQGWETHFGKKITHTRDIARDLPSDTVLFAHACLQTIRAKLHADKRKDGTLMNKLNASEGKLRERIRRLATYPGDLLFSKIDARNGAVGLIPDSIAKAVVTSEYPVFAPKSDKLRPLFLRHLLRAEHFKANLQRKASGTSGRKRVTPEGFLSLTVPVPSLAEQDALTTAYTDALSRAELLAQEANAIERAGWQAFEAALGLAPSTPLPNRPMFVARFKDVERWSHESILRTSTLGPGYTPSWPLARLGDLVADLDNGWSLKCHDHPAREDKWGVLKLGAVSFGTFDELENKELPATLKPRPEYEVRSGDVLISRANVVRYVGACAYVESTQPKLMLCDKIFRVRFHLNGKLLLRFLAEAMKLNSVREQVESRLTGTSPTMKNISKPSLLDLQFPLPDEDVQQHLVDDLATARTNAASKRAEAIALRQSAWSAFESALFTSVEDAEE